MARDIPPVEIADVYVLGATGRAILIQLPNGDEHWIPRSCIIEEASPDVQEKGDHGTIVIAGWLADKKGIVE